VVVRAFYHQIAVPWTLRIRWHNCLALAGNMSYICSHMHRKGNTVVDALAKNGHSLPSLHSQWWSEPPLFILHLLHRDGLGLPYLRFSSL